MNYYLAIDIGASSGRHMLGCVRDGVLDFEEVYRFPNVMVEKEGTLVWDFVKMFEEIISGIKRCAEIGKIPVSIGIDTWGVDFVLLDGQGNVIGDTVAYRDSRTEGMDKEVFKLMPEKDLYSRTGIPTLIFNTIFQLMAVKKAGFPANAKTMLLTPDYLHYRLCGVAKTEYSIATTTGLVNAKTREWDREIIDTCGFPQDIFQEIVSPGSYLGELSEEIQGLVGFNAKVVVPAAHDTGSAVVAIPSAAKDTLFISSGTWSLIGVERQTPDCSPESMSLNFTNEGGYGYSIRYLKNIMGLWMIQSVNKELDGAYSFSELSQMAEETDIKSIVDCDEQRFFAPKSMIKEIKAACAESGQVVPESPGELAAVIYRSLAVCYKNAIKNLESITGKTYPVIHIMGGGANVKILNRLTEEYSGKKVTAGPAEATAIGNLLSQMIWDGQFKDLSEARACVKKLL